MNRKTCMGIMEILWYVFYTAIRNLIGEHTMYSVLS